jgi:hypothetical protein
MGMHTRRSSHCTISCFAVLVLLAQLMLAATHVHLPGTHGVRATLSASHETGRMPAGPVHPDDGVCSLCWAQAAVSNLLVPPAIELRVPATLAATRLTPVFHRLAERNAPNAFRPRAPPA